AGKDYTAKNCIVRAYTLRYPAADFPIGTSITNTLSATGTPSGGTEGPIGTNAVITETIGEPTPGVRLEKFASDVLAGSIPPSTGFVWGIRADTKSSNAPVPDLVWYDTLPTTPTGIVPLRVKLGTWNSPPTTNAPGGSDVRLTLSYSADTGDCQAATYTDLVVDAVSAIAPNERDIPADTHCLRWAFKDLGPDGPAVPRGWQFNGAYAPSIFADTSAVTAPYPVEVQNCVSATFTKFDGSTGSAGPVCDKSFIEEATPAISLSKAVTNGSSFTPESEVKFKLSANHVSGDSTGAVVNPVIADLLPAELEFVRWDAFKKNTAASALPEPNMEVIPDYQGSGRTLVRFTWSDTVPAGAVKRDGSAGTPNAATFPLGGAMDVSITTKVKAGTPVGTYTNTMAFFDNSPRFTCHASSKVDTEDLDGDGSTTDDACTKPLNFKVTSAAIVAAEKWVKGNVTTYPNVDDPLTSPTVSNDQCPNDGDGYTRFPCVAQVEHAGAFNYKVVVTNKGNEALTDYILYDVLPAKGDTGVGQPVA
ncbi:MAG: hypothetical protein ACK4RS_04920, partial [Thiothrix sp.]